MILDKGLVIDIFIRVQLVGIELLTIDVRICIASVDTYLRFAEATNRLDLYDRRKRGASLPELVEGMAESGTRRVVKGKAKGVLEAAKDTIEETLGGRRRDTGETRHARPPRGEPEW
jgi:hypothetical protein